MSSERDEIHMPCVQSCGVSSEQNPRFRRHMEDAHTIKGDFGDDSRSAFVGVYDGHGGSRVARYLSENLHNRFLAELRARPQARMAELIARAYVTTDKEIEGLKIPNQGATVVTCYISPTISPNSESTSMLSLHTANAGDARAVLCRGGRALRLTYDHKPEDEGEAARVQSAGGFIVAGRVNAILGVTRSLGDHAIKECILPYPHTSEVELGANDEFIIVACDGLWDVMTDQDAVDTVRSVSHGVDMSDALVKSAMEKGTTDNISVVCMRFRPS